MVLKQLRFVTYNYYYGVYIFIEKIIIADYFFSVLDTLKKKRITFEHLFIFRFL